MKIIFNSLLFIFTAVSAYVTYTLTSSLANDAAQLVAFSALGFAFDILKCLLPSTFLLCFAGGKWREGLIVLTAYCCLTLFSFYASMQLFDKSAERQIVETVKSTTAYTTLEQQLANLQSSYDELVTLGYISKANDKFNEPMLALGGKMTALINQAKADKSRNLQNLVVNIIVSILLEIAVLSCHISIATRTAKRPKNARETPAKSSEFEGEKGVNPADFTASRIPAAKGLDGNLAADFAANQSARKSARKSSRKTPVNELAALLKSNGDEGLSYAKIINKYGIRNKDTIRDAKRILSSEIEQKDVVKEGAAKDSAVRESSEKECNIILLPALSC